MAHDRDFLPAAGHDWLLPFYDPLQRWVGFAAALGQLVEQADLQPGQSVLDLGCGTGNLALAVAAQAPDAELYALDPDPKALARARAKAERAGARIRFESGYGQSLPFEDAAFDRVLSSLMLHHLDLEAKQQTLREVRRVLRPGGVFHVLDFAGGEAHRGLLARLLHSRELLHDHRGEGIPRLLEQAGLADAREVGHRRTLFGRVGYFRADRPRQGAVASG